MFFALVLQGGGLYIEFGNVTLSSCTITGNIDARGYVRAHVQCFPSPSWDEDINHEPY
jgi:hypothetical protein